MQNKKYELTPKTIVVNGHTLSRIKALKDFGDVKEGELGGFIEKETNLSQEGTCWVSDNAFVFGDAQVSDDALVSDGARVYNDALVFGGARVFGGAFVSGDARVYDDAWVCDNAHVDNYASVYGNALVFGYASVFGNACVFGHTWVYGNACVFGNAQVCGNALVSGDVRVYDNAEVYGDAWVRGNAIVNFFFVIRTGLFGGKNDKNDLFMRCPQKGAFTAFKKVSGGLIAEIVVPKTAKRSSSFGHICRCNRAKVVAFYNADGSKSDAMSARSFFDGSFVYKVGKTAKVPNFDENRWNECSAGIHFFMSFEEARDYGE